MYKPWALPIAICDRPDPKNICTVVNNYGGSAILHHALCINNELCRLRFAIGEADSKNICVMFNNLGGSGVSRCALCINIESADCDM